MSAQPFNARYDDGGSFRAEVDTGEGRWYTNALTFDSESDAEAYARDLYSRWMLVRQWRVVPISTPMREEVTA